MSGQLLYSNCGLSEKTKQRKYVSFGCLLNFSVTIPFLGTESP